MGMEWVERKLRVTNDPRDAERADVIAAMHKARGKDVPLPRREQVGKADKFTAVEKRALSKDGAIILKPLDQTIPSQREAQRQKEKPSFYFVANAEDGLLNVPSSLAEVAIYPDPDRFFIPGTGGKDLATQERMVSRDGETLRERLGLSGVDVRIPNEASTLTGITFDYLDQTGEWLFGPDYGYRYGRTKNPTTKSGSPAAVVGRASPAYGLHVVGFEPADGDGLVRAVRLVVPNHGNK